MDDPKANDISEEQLTEIVTPFLPEIKTTGKQNKGS